MKSSRKKAVIEAGIFPKVLEDLFPNLQSTGIDQYLVNCCFHQDKTPSLSVNTSNGLFNCFSCGKQGNFFDLYMQKKSVDFKTALIDLENIAGITPVQKTKQKIEVVATFIYHDEKSKKVYWKKRFEPGFGGRSKSFAFYHKKNGKEAKGRGGDPLLYNLHRLVAAPPDAPFFFCEGEAKADIFTAWEMYGTSLDSGGQSGKGAAWRSEFSQYFKDREVYLLPDNDETGEIYIYSLAEKILPVASSVKILRLPDLPAKGDIIDWLRIQQGGNLE